MTKKYKTTQTIVWILGIILFLVITLGESFKWW